MWIIRVEWSKTEWCNNFLVAKKVLFFYPSANNKIVALKEIRLQEEEGAPFTAIREGTELLSIVLALGINHYCQRIIMRYFLLLKISWYPRCSTTQLQSIFQHACSAFSLRLIFLQAIFLPWMKMFWEKTMNNNYS